MVAAPENDPPVPTVALAPFTSTCRLVTAGSLVTTVPVTVADPPAAPGIGRTASSIGAPKSAVRSSSASRSRRRVSTKKLKLLSTDVAVPSYRPGGRKACPLPTGLPSKLKELALADRTSSRPFGSVYWLWKADQESDVPPAGGLNFTVAKRK